MTSYTDLSEMAELEKQIEDAIYGEEELTKQDAANLLGDIKQTIKELLQASLGILERVEPHEKNVARKYWYAHIELLLEIDEIEFDLRKAATALTKLKINYAEFPGSKIEPEALAEFCDELQTSIDKTVQCIDIWQKEIQAEEREVI